MMRSHRFKNVQLQNVNYINMYAFQYHYKGCFVLLIHETRIEGQGEERDNEKNVLSVSRPTHCKWTRGMSEETHPMNPEKSNT